MEVRDDGDGDGDADADGDDDEMSVGEDVRLGMKIWGMVNVSAALQSPLWKNLPENPPDPLNLVQTGLP